MHLLPTPPRPSRWPTIWQGVLAFVTVITPLCAAWVAGKFASEGSKQATQARIMELAVGILRSPPSEKTIDLRSWAVDLLDTVSPVDVPAEVRRSLIDSVPFPVVDWSAPGGGRLSPTGSFTAPSIPGRYPVVACFNGMCDTTWVTVTDLVVPKAQR